MRCLNCAKIIYPKTSQYWYEESGLSNVILRNIPVYECSCGVSYASIFRIKRLNELIAQVLIEKPALLTGEEIRFLRKTLYLSSMDFSKDLGIGKTTLSKWENSRQQHSEGHDRLIRALFLIHKGVKGQAARKIWELLAELQLSKADIDYLIVAEKLDTDYSVI